MVVDMDSGTTAMVQVVGGHKAYGQDAVLNNLNMTVPSGKMPIVPKLTLYICVDPRERVYQAVYLTCLTSSELVSKVCAVLGLHSSQVASMFVEGPNGIKLVLNDLLVSHLNDHSTYSISTVHDGPERYQLLLKQSEHTPTP
ncbi:hypothetical protein GE061_020044 [Apolygus lucorum]|uniref:GRHL1/CP2 C-terminal domain-containing protein n=1 Tax=Apolygus lucorum TaxID=248454 RepID=A0A8S9X9V5_APOLU|nr:hypothetical protein GE061_020044 [Apolygus lucorum]